MREKRATSIPSQIGPNSGYQLPGTTSRRPCYGDQGARWAVELAANSGTVPGAELRY